MIVNNICMVRILVTAPCGFGSRKIEVEMSDGSRKEYSASGPDMAKFVSDMLRCHESFIPLAFEKLEPSLTVAEPETVDTSPTESFIEDYTPPPKSPPKPKPAPKKRRGRPPGSKNRPKKKMSLTS